MSSIYCLPLEKNQGRVAWYEEKRLGLDWAVAGYHALCDFSIRWISLFRFLIACSIEFESSTIYTQDWTNHHRSYSVSAHPYPDTYNIPQQAIRLDPSLARECICAHGSSCPVKRTWNSGTPAQCHFQSWSSSEVWICIRRADVLRSYRVRSTESNLTYLILVYYSYCMATREVGPHRRTGAPLCDLVDRLEGDKMNTSIHH